MAKQTNIRIGKMASITECKDTKGRLKYMVNIHNTYCTVEEDAEYMSVGYMNYEDAETIYKIIEKCTFAEY